MNIPRTRKWALKGHDFRRALSNQSLHLIPDSHPIALPMAALTLPQRAQRKYAYVKQRAAHEIRRAPAKLKVGEEGEEGTNSSREAQEG
jgi:hypothetical protein